MTVRKSWYERRVGGAALLACPCRGAASAVASHSTHTTTEECSHAPAGGGRTIDSQSAPPYGGAHDSTLGAAGSAARLGDCAWYVRARGRQPDPARSGLEGDRLAGHSAAPEFPSSAHRRNPRSADRGAATQEPHWLVAAGDRCWRRDLPHSRLRRYARAADRRIAKELGGMACLGVQRHRNDWCDLARVRDPVFPRRTTAAGAALALGRMGGVRRRYGVGRVVDDPAVADPAVAAASERAQPAGRACARRNHQPGQSLLL